MTAPVDDQSKKTYEDDQIVVDAQQQCHVRKVLDDQAIWHVETDSIRALGLTQLKLDKGTLQHAIDELRRSDDALRRYIDGARALRGMDPATDIDIKTLDHLDVLLFFLRQHFARNYRGWPVTVAKHRRVRGTDGMGEINGGVPRPVVASGAGFLAPQPGVESFDWPDSPKGEGVRIALLDTRVLPHPRMIKNLVGTYDAFLAPAMTYLSPRAGHGTFSASRILSKAPSATVLLRPVLDEFGNGSAWDVAKALAELLDEAVDIIVLPLGCETDDGEPPLLLSRPTQLHAWRIPVVTAGGNYDKVPSKGGPAPTYPAGQEGVISVGAKNEDGSDAKFSPGAPWLDTRATGVNVPGLFLSGTAPVTTGLAEGTGVTTYVPFNGQVRISGTSAAVVDIAGEIAAALVKPKQYLHSFTPVC
jgi:hypothetical protein